MTVVLGLSSILIQTNLAQRKMALVEFASHDYVEITKGASAYIADESAALLKAVKSFIYSTENSETSLENLENQFNQFHSDMNSSASSSIREFLDYYIQKSTFINKLELKAKKEFKEDLDLNHNFNLARSEFHEIKNIDSQPDYKTSLITEDRLSYYNPRLVSSYFNFAVEFVSDDKLMIADNLLQKIVTDSADYDAIVANPENFNLDIDISGLSESDFPNTLVLNTKYPVFKFDNKDEEESSSKEIREISFISTAQINTTSDIELRPIVFPKVPKINQSPTFPPLPIIEIENIPISPPSAPIAENNNLTNFDLGIRSLPANSHGIFVDSDKVVSADNPLRIASSKSNGLSTLFIDENGHIVMSIGKAFEGNSRLGLPDNSLNFNHEGIEVLDTFSDQHGKQSLGSKDSLSGLSFQNSESNSVNNNSEINSGAEILAENPSVVLDILPRQHNRYGTVNESFKVNGVEIPAGAVVVATKSENTKNRIDKNSDFNYFKVYDASGALITKFHQGSIQSNKKLKNIDLQSFNTEKGFEDADGSSIYQSFSTADLFNGQDAETAVKSFLNIQADLGDSLQLNINEKNKKWHKDLYRNFKSQGISYTGSTLEVNDKEAAAELYIAEKVYVDDTAKSLDKAQFTALVDLEDARGKVESAKDKLVATKSDLKKQGYSKAKIDKKLKEQVKEIKVAKKERKAVEKSFTKTRKDYDNYIKNRAVPKAKIKAALAKPVVVKAAPKVFKVAPKKSAPKPKKRKRRR
ncbi:MAG: hypothetical protein HRT47_01960 [Candidatus Caenarcaniphilales bacterium]|nr:hypothetical protein [Candidatus Caenarcaniphilales bacterium]